MVGTKTDTVASLRKKGYSVQVIHFRRYKEKDNIYYSGYKFPDAELLPHGGRTVVKLLLPDDDNTTLTGISNCSNKDGYIKKRGVQIALARAIKQVKK